MKKGKNQLSEKEMELKGFFQMRWEGVPVPKPTYRFDVGEKVVYGAMEGIIDECFDDGKYYGMHCVNPRKPENPPVYRVGWWHQIRPVNTRTETKFAQEKVFKLNFSNTTIESLLHDNYSFGINSSPSYQRELVWTDRDKEKLLESIFMGADIGKFVLKRKGFDTQNELFEIIDGKQRLNTLCEFYENRLKFKGVYYNELSGKDANAFLDHLIAKAVVDEIDDKNTMKLFLFLNRGGKAMSEEHLQKVEKMLSDLENK